MYPEYCERCRGLMPGQIFTESTAAALKNTGMRSCACIEAQKEALESAAKMLEDNMGHLAPGTAVGLWNDCWRGGMRCAINEIRSHRPWEKPKPPKPKVSRKAVEDAVDAEMPLLGVQYYEVKRAVMSGLRRVLDLTDEEE